MPLHFVLIAGAGVFTNHLLLGSRLVSIGFGMVLVAALWHQPPVWREQGCCASGDSGRAIRLSRCSLERHGRHMLCRHVHARGAILSEGSSFRAPKTARFSGGV